MGYFSHKATRADLVLGHTIQEPDASWCRAFVVYGRSSMDWGMFFTIVAQVLIGTVVLFVITTVVNVVLKNWKEN